MARLENALRWPLRQFKFKCFVLVMTVLLSLSFMQKLDTYFSSQNTTEFDYEDVKYTIIRKRREGPEQKIVHVDLKGAPPKIEYLLQLIKFIKSAGATGILMEYEDMFPYKGHLEGISALNAYTPSDVAQIEETAQKNNITIIPLIPSFGHFEFVLKLEKFKNFREVDYDPETLCPSRSGIYTVLLEMIHQVLEVHKNSKYVHLGCDQVEPVGVCAKCQSIVKRKNLLRHDLFLGHLRKVAEFINITHPGVRPIVWGNDLVRHTRSALTKYKIPDLVDIMLSNYKVDLNTFPSVKLITGIAKVFPQIWVAGSYKGTTELFNLVPEIDFHLVNSRYWKQFILEWKHEIVFKGIVFTGQQRFSHFEVLTELLPVSIPSLAISLQPFQESNDFDYEVLKQSLTCTDFLPLNPNAFGNLEQLDALHCDFPGFEVYRAVFHFFESSVIIKQLLQNPSLQYFGFYNILHSEGRPSYVRNIVLSEYETQIRKMKELEDMIIAAMIKLYDNYTIDEWIMTYVIPLRVNLQTELAVLSSLVNKRVWQRHPLGNDRGRYNEILNNLCPENDRFTCSFSLLPKFIR